MSTTKRTRRSAARADASGSEGALGQEPVSVVPVAADDLDDILGEIVGPGTPVPVHALESEPDEIDDGDPLEDIIGALFEPADAAVEDDIFDDAAAPSEPEPAMSRGDNPEPPSGQPASDPAEGRDPPGAVDDAAAPLSEPLPAGGQEDLQSVDAAPAKTTLASRVRKLTGRALPRLAGTREVSRKAYAGGLGLIGVLTLVSVGQAAVLLSRPAAPAGQAHRNPGHVPAPATLPINFATVDLARFSDKTRSLPEGGRQILRNPAVKEAIVQLDSGEQLYRQLQSLAARSAAADLVTIRNNRVRITSCGAAGCGDKAFLLTYEIVAKRAVVCVTEKYLDGAYLSSRYSPSGYSEVPHCG